MSNVWFDLTCIRHYLLLSQVLNIFGKLRNTTTALAQKPVFFHSKSTTDVNLLIFLFVGWHCQKILTTLTLHAKSFHITPAGIPFQETRFLSSLLMESSLFLEIITSKQMLQAFLFSFWLKISRKREYINISERTITSKISYKNMITK